MTDKVCETPPQLLSSPKVTDFEVGDALPTLTGILYRHRKQLCLQVVYSVNTYRVCAKCQALCQPWGDPAKQR